MNPNALKILSENLKSSFNTISEAFRNKPSEETLVLLEKACLTLSVAISSVLTVFFFLNANKALALFYLFQTSVCAGLLFLTIRREKP